jgi:outer membrane protein assembly factor BamA
VYPLKWDPIRRRNLVHGVIFFDAGGVWTEVTPAREAFENFDLDRIRSSVGVGIRLYPGGMPIPIEIYWSFPFAQEDDYLSRLQIGIFGMAF